MKIMIAGGGTGGHLFPAMALADAFSARIPDVKIAFAGTDQGLEARLIPQTGYQLLTVPVYGMVGVGWVRRLFALSLLPAALQAASRIVGEFQPDLVVGVGGYASGPVLFSAGIRRIPRVIMEQNAVPGLTNRIFGPSVERVFLSFAQAKTHFKPGKHGDTHYQCPGNPVRQTILDAPQKSAGDGTHILVFGGSQGAQAINEAMLEAAPPLLAEHPKLTITHQTGQAARRPMVRDYTTALGKASMASVLRQYGEANPERDPSVSVPKTPAEKAIRDDYNGPPRLDVVDFIDDMGSAYAQADLVICRAGATSIAELAAIGRPAILIPYPHATHDHQTANAQALVDAGAALLLPQNELSGERLKQLIDELTGDPERLTRMATAAQQLGRPDAANRIVSDCLSLLPDSTTPLCDTGATP